MPGGAHENMKAWEPEEDHMIMMMVQTEGPKWKQIVKKLPGRTVSSVRNRYQRIEKGRKLREEGTELKNRCHACGQPKRGHICQAKMRGGPQVDMQSNGLALGPPGGGPSMLLGDALFPQPPSGGGGIPRGGLMGPPGSGPGSGSGFPALKRTRSGSRLVPVDGGAPSAAGGLVSHGFTVDVNSAMGPPPGSQYGAPTLQRTNTAFFKDLAANEDLFSPTSREMFFAWADSPRDAQPSVSHVAHDMAAPPSLRRVASRDGVSEPPKLTRSVASYLREMSEEVPGAHLVCKAALPWPVLG